MGLFSFFRKNKQDPTPAEGQFLSRAEEDSNSVRGRGKRKKDSAPVDPVLPEKKRARRRLVGAVALVLAVVIGLPMILDSEPKPLADDIAIQIPSKDKVTPLGAGNQASAAASSRVAASTSLDKKEEIVEMPAAPSGAATAVSIPAAAAKPVVAATTTAVDAGKPSSNQQTAIKADTKTESKSEDKSKADAKAAQAVEKANDAARAKAILEGKSGATASPATTADKKAAKFAVQVAALASREKINELQGKLKDAGIKSYTQKVATEGGDRTRIRVGPFASKEEAEKLHAKLVKIGLNGTLVPLTN